MTQPELAEAAGMSQPRISEIERAGERRLNLETLLRLASAFDVALQVRFISFSDFVDYQDSIDFDELYIRPFNEDIAHLEKIERQMESVVRMDKPSAFKSAQMADGQAITKNALQSAVKEQKGPGETDYGESSINRAS